LSPYAGAEDIIPYSSILIVALSTFIQPKVLVVAIGKTF